jgi:site-specific DNA-cytosine methylase
VECERLMGWPDGWTIPLEWRGRRYAAPTFVKVARPSGPDGIGERWAAEGTSPTLSSFDASDTRAVSLVGDEAPTVLGASGGENRTTDLNVAFVSSLDTRRGGADDNEAQAGHLIPDGLDSLIPDGLDSNRYRCIGNGVVAPVAEWIGHRLAAWAS